MYLKNLELTYFTDHHANVVGSMNMCIFYRVAMAFLSFLDECDGT